MFVVQTFHNKVRNMVLKYVICKSYSSIYFKDNHTDAVNLYMRRENTIFFSKDKLHGYDQRLKFKPSIMKIFPVLFVLRIYISVSVIFQAHIHHTTDHTKHFVRRPALKV